MTNHQYDNDRYHHPSTGNVAASNLSSYARCNSSRIGIIIIILLQLNQLFLFHRKIRLLDDDSIVSSENRSINNQADINYRTTTSLDNSNPKQGSSFQQRQQQQQQRLLPVDHRLDDVNGLCQIEMEMMWMRQRCFVESYDLHHHDFDHLSLECQEFIEREQRNNVHLHRPWHYKHLTNHSMSSSSSSSSSLFQPMPLHYFAYMAGQGFGRIIQHAVKSCMVAALLHRPCSMDLIRDKYYNLRSFVQPSPNLDWDYTSQLLLQQQQQQHPTNLNHINFAKNISHALHHMPKGYLKGHGWEDPSVTLPSYNDVLPMIWREDDDHYANGNTVMKTESNAKKKNRPNRTSAAVKIQKKFILWDGYNPNHGHKVLLSPNFADGWYGYGKDHIRLGSQWDTMSTRSSSACTANYIKTRLQNEMFVPTSLAVELHKERRKLLFGQPEKPGPNIESHDEKFEEDEDDRQPYGAIHLRMNILNRDMYKMGVTKERVLEGLKDCFQVLSTSSTTASDSTKWWLISDDIQVAKYISQSIDGVYSYANSATEAYGHNSTSGNTGNQPIIKGAHSGDAINKKFGQEALAPSMIDWMGLHESDIALVTYDSAYGESGARGNGKVHVGQCGGNVVQQQQQGQTTNRHPNRTFPMFFIYRHPAN